MVKYFYIYTCRIFPCLHILNFNKKHYSDTCRCGNQYWKIPQWIVDIVLVMNATVADLFLLYVLIKSDKMKIVKIL